MRSYTVRFEFNRKAVFYKPHWCWWKKSKVVNIRKKEEQVTLLLLFFSHSVVSDSLQPHGLQHARLPCPSLSSGICSNSCPLSRWCHPTISSAAALFSSCPQSFIASGSFLISRLFASGGQSSEASASASVLPMNIQDWFPLGLTGLAPCSSRDSQESSPAPQFKSINSSVLSLLYSRSLTSLHDWWHFSWASLNLHGRGGGRPAQGLSPNLSLPSSTSHPLPSSAQNKTKKTLRRKRANFKRGKHPWDQRNLHNPQWQTGTSRRAIWLNKDIRSLEGLSSLCHVCLLVFEIYFFSFQAWKPSAF